MKNKYQEIAVRITHISSNLILIIGLIVLIVLGYKIYKASEDRNMLCLNNPIQYGADEMSESINEQVTCTCGAKGINPFIATGNYSLR